MSLSERQHNALAIALGAKGPRDETPDARAAVFIDRMHKAKIVLVDAARLDLLNNIVMAVRKILKELASVEEGVFYTGVEEISGDVVLDALIEHGLMVKTEHGAVMAPALISLFRGVPAASPHLVRLADALTASARLADSIGCCNDRADKAAP